MRGYGRRTLALGIAVGLIGLAGPSSASAATPVGQTFAPTQTCDATWLQASSPGGTSYTMPSPGVITSWSVEAAGGIGEVALKVGHLEFPGGPPDMVITGGTSPPQQLANNVVNTFPARVSVNAGDLLGLFTSNLISSFTCRNSGSSQAWYRSGNIAPGGPPATVTGNGLVQLDVSAVLEPDADNDGFGDETQDCSVGDPSLTVDCDAPDTTITNQPEAKTKKKQATFEFTSEPGASFECSLNGAAFTSCTSPLSVKGKKGKNSFAVRAKDAAGNVDGSPATFDWKVKKKKK